MNGHFLPVHSLAAEPLRSPSAWSPGCNHLQGDIKGKVMKDDQEQKTEDQIGLIATVFVY